MDAKTLLNDFVTAVKGLSSVDGVVQEVILGGSAMTRLPCITIMKRAEADLALQPGAMTDHLVEVRLRWPVRDYPGFLAATDVQDEDSVCGQMKRIVEVGEVFIEWDVESGAGLMAGAESRNQAAYEWVCQFKATFGTES